LATYDELAGSVSLTWDAVDEADHYTVERKPSGADSFKKIAEVSDTSYTDDSLSSADEYVYTVSAVASDGSVGPAATASVSTNAINQYETFASTNVSFGEVNDNYVVDANGADVWDGTDEYSVVYADDGVTVTAKIESQEDTSPWAKAGIMFRNNATGASESSGYSTVGVTPDNGYVTQCDSDADGHC